MSEAELVVRSDANTSSQHGTCKLLGVQPDSVAEWTLIFTMTINTAMRRPREIGYAGENLDFLLLRENLKPIWIVF